MFAYYECVNNPSASRMLLDAASNWLREKGLKAMRGPWSFVSQEWGSVVEGFTPPPVVMAPYNPPWYNEHYLTYGLEKIKDLLVYLIDCRQGYQVPERIILLTDKIAHRYGIRTRMVDMRNFEQDVNLIMELSNASLVDNWGYAPVTDAEAKAMANDLKPVIHPKAVLFAEEIATGRPIGFAISIPDVNILLKKIGGRLFPFGWLRLLWGLPRLHQYRMFALGVIPEYHGKAVDSLLYRAMYDLLIHPDLRMEINYVLEDNDPMNNAILKLGASPMRRYRVYQMDLQR
jgi:GNAT superfamily N-acetyltransferase